MFGSGNALHIHGDLNATVPIKVIGAPKSLTDLYFNSQKLSFTTDSVTGEWTSTLQYSTPSLNLPDLANLDWKYLDGLPEIQPGYDDSLWTKADHTYTTNPERGLTTPTSLYGSDYGYHTGALLFRGHFTSTGAESSFTVETQGGSGFGSSVWLDSTYLGSWPGIDKAASHKDTYTVPNLKSGTSHVITVIVDNNGLDEEWTVGQDTMKNPRGILNYSFNTGNQSSISWKITGNLGGEKYVDKDRGPLNEGGLYAERQGFTQPYPPNNNWASGNPMAGTKSAGVAFYQASFKLNIPKDYDVPLSFYFGNTTMNGATADYQAQLWVNGYQFGKYINNIGPQSKFPVPQGILNYYGMNWVAVEVWSRQANGAQLTNFSLVADTPLWTSYQAPEMVPTPNYAKRAGAY